MVCQVLVITIHHHDDSIIIIAKLFIIFIGINTNHLLCHQHHNRKRHRHRNHTNKMHRIQLFLTYKTYVIGSFNNQVFLRKFSQGSFYVH
jgi:hypothetical protein